MAQQTSNNLVSTIDTLREVIEDISLRTGIPAFPMGVSVIDDMTHGFHKREVTVISSRPSHGKTSFSLFTTWESAKRGSSVMFVSLEMSRQNVIERLMCIEFGLHGWKLRKGFADEVKKATECEDRMSSRLLSTTFEVIDNLGRRAEEIEQILEQYTPDILVIDHIQKISSTGFPSKYEALSHYVYTMQDLAKKYNVAIVLNSQINRGGAKGENTNESLKGSGEIEECADCIVRLVWPSRDNPQHIDPNEYIVQVEKNRHGPCDRAVIDFDSKSFKFAVKPVVSFNKPWGLQHGNKERAGSDEA